MRDLTHFVNDVLMRLGHHGWHVKQVSHSVEGYCWKSRKILEIGMAGPCPERLALHEIAHIRTSKWCNNRHDYGFWFAYDDLLRRFLDPQGLNGEEREDREHWKGVGRYSRIYE